PRSVIAAAARTRPNHEHSEVHDMKSFIPFKRLLPAAIVAAAAAASLVQVAQGGPPPPSVPGPIQVLDGSKVFLIGHAVGVQIYSCNGTAWSFVAPRDRKSTRLNSSHDQIS